MPKIVIADDHPLTLDGTASFLESAGHEVVATCIDGQATLDAIATLQPHVALIDINMPVKDGFDVLAEATARFQRTRMVMLTMHVDYGVYLKAKNLGAAGYVVKDMAVEELLPCIEAVCAGEHFKSAYIESWSATASQENQLQSPLTPIEQKILELIKNQHPSRHIADLLMITEKTVEKHRSHIIEKLGLPKEKNILLKWALQQSE